MARARTSDHREDDDRRNEPPALQTEWNRLLTIMPDPVKVAIPINLWNRDLLYALDLATEEVPVADVAWLFDVPLWAVDGNPFQVTPNQVRTDPGRFAAQYERTMNSDLTWPIHIIRHSRRWTILDGVHRLLKADILGQHSIRAMILGDEHLASIMY
jgi:hypothetical protein